MQRRNLMKAALLAGGTFATRSASARPVVKPKRSTDMNMTEGARGAKLFHRSWGTGQPLLFLAAWGLHSEAWQYQMVPLAEAGFRCIAFDRRSHGRSSDPGTGYDMDTLA